MSPVPAGAYLGLLWGSNRSGLESDEEWSDCKGSVVKNLQFYPGYTEGPVRAF